MRITENSPRGDIPYLLGHGIRTHYKHTKIRVFGVCIIYGRVTRKKVDNRYNEVYLMRYAATTFLSYFEKQTNNFIYT